MKHVLGGCYVLFNLRIHAPHQDLADVAERVVMTVNAAVFLSWLSLIRTDPFLDRDSSLGSPVFGQEEPFCGKSGEGAPSEQPVSSGN